MSLLSLPIFKNDEISSAFVKANNYLLTTNSVSFTCNRCENLKILNSLWTTHYKAFIDFNQNKIQFSNDRDKTVFLLRWN